MLRSSSIPCIEKLLKPAVVDKSTIEKLLEQKQIVQKSNYDKLAKELPPLHQGDHVRVRTPGFHPQWDPAVVLETPKPEKPRSYIIQHEQGGIYKRNRKHLLRTGETHTPNKPDDDELNDTEMPARTKSPHPVPGQTTAAQPSPQPSVAGKTPTPEAYRTRAGRARKPRLILDL